jgi:hypothetical protein
MSDSGIKGITAQRWRKPQPVLEYLEADAGEFPERVATARWRASAKVALLNSVGTAGLERRIGL